MTTDRETYEVATRELGRAILALGKVQAALQDAGDEGDPVARTGAGLLAEALRITVRVATALAEGGDRRAP